VNATPVPQAEPQRMWYLVTGFATYRRIWGTSVHAETARLSLVEEVLSATEFRKRYMTTTGSHCVLRVEPRQPGTLGVRADRRDEDMQRLIAERDTLREVIENMREARDREARRVNAARQALIDTKYFTAEQVDPDIAPRITEMFNALNALIAERDNALADNEVWIRKLREIRDIAS
jgi:hypothetical protein